MKSQRIPLVYREQSQFINCQSKRNILETTPVDVIVSNEPISLFLEPDLTLKKKKKFIRPFNKILVFRILFDMKTKATFSGKVPKSKSR